VRVSVTGVEDREGWTTGVEAAARPAGHPRLRRTLVVLAVLVGVLVPYAVAMSVLWSSMGDDVRFAARERNGVHYLGPLVRLLGAETDVQSAAVAGATPNTETVLAAIPAVDQVDSTLGAGLGTQQRWAELRGRLQALLNAPGTGAAAYANFGEVVDLTTAMIISVGDSSDVIHDPQLDAYYVMDAAVQRIPAIVVQAGRLYDLTVLNGSSAATTPSVVVAVDQVQRQASAADTGLRKSFLATQSRTLGPALLDDLDRFRDAVTAMAPPVGEVNGTRPAVSLAALRADRVQVRDSALSMETVALQQLDALLQARHDHLVAQQRLVVAVTIAGALLVVIALWFAAPRRRRQTEEEEPEPERPVTGDGAAEPEQPELVEALQLIEARRLARVGRDRSSSGETR
jgi:hypothetical protein